MIKTYIVYKHTNKLNNKVYIGITKHGKNPNQRWKNGFGYQYNSKFFSEIVQYGWENFNHEILENNLTLEEAEQLEKKYIKLYNSIEQGYNQSPGGHAPSDEGCKKIAQALTGIKRAQESIDKQMNTKQDRYGSGKGINYLGGLNKKVLCHETGDVFISAEDAGRWSGTNKICLCCNGERKHAGKHPITGEPLTWSYVSSETPITISCEERTIPIKTVQKIQCIETKEIYTSASEASRKTGIATCNILRVCHGQRKTAGKLHWIFYNEEE